MIVQADLAQLVAPGGGVVGRLALIGDIPQHMALVVLRPGLPQVRADTPIGEAHLIVGPARPGQTADADETATLHQIGLNAFQAGAEGRQRKVRLADIQHVIGLGPSRSGGGLQLRHLGVREMFGP